MVECGGLLIRCIVERRYRGFKSHPLRIFFTEGFEWSEGRNCEQAQQFQRLVANAMNKEHCMASLPSR